MVRPAPVRSKLRLTLASMTLSVFSSMKSLTSAANRINNITQLHDFSSSSSNPLLLHLLLPLFCILVGKSPHFLYAYWEGKSQSLFTETKRAMIWHFWTGKHPSVKSVEIFNFLLVRASYENNSRRCTRCSWIKRRFMYGTSPINKLKKMYKKRETRKDWIQRRYFPPSFLHDVTIEVNEQPPERGTQ